MTFASTGLSPYCLKEFEYIINHSVDVKKLFRLFVCFPNNATRQQRKKRKTKKKKETFFFLFTWFE